MNGLSDTQVEQMLEHAAEKGARKALHDLGLSDDDAPKDVRELRGLLTSWRDVRKTALNTMVRVMTTVLLAAIAAGTWANWHK